MFFALQRNVCRMSQHTLLVTLEKEKGINIFSLRLVYPVPLRLPGSQ